MNSFYLAVLAILVAMLVLVGLLYAHRKARALVQLCLHAWDAKRNAPAWCALLFQLMRSLDGLMRALLVSSILAIALVLLLTVNHYQAPPPLDGPRLPVPSSGKDATALWLTALVMLAGVVLLWARSRLARGIGAVALLCGLFNGYLFKDVKIEQLAKLEFKLDKLGFTFTKNEFNSDVKVDVAAEVAKQLADFAPELFEPIAGFKLGKAEVPPEMHARVEAICRRWHAKGDDHVGRAPRGMLLVIGSADRLPLTGALVGRYDSNVGLARARAEQVKSRLATDCGVPRQQMLAVIAGPASTPERREKNEPAGFPDDRSVVVWALWNAAADAAAATATAAHAEK